MSKTVYPKEQPQVTLADRHARFLQALRELMKAHGVESIASEEKYPAKGAFTMEFTYNYRYDSDRYVLEGGLVELNEIEAGE